MKMLQEYRASTVIVIPIFSQCTRVNDCSIYDIYNAAILYALDNIVASFRYVLIIAWVQYLHWHAVW